MEMILSPSILAADYTHLGEDITRCVEAGAQYIHIDIMDGLFVPSISIGIPVVSSIRGCTKAVFDIHLMIENPIRYVEAFAKAGADIITFHYEACDDGKEVYDTIEKIRACGCKVGISIKPKTELDVLDPFLNLIDMVLLMTVEPGFGGQKYIEESTDRISRMHKSLEENAPNVRLEVDGGIHLGNLETVLQAGADTIVAGTAVFKGDIEKNVSAFLQKQ